MNFTNIFKIIISLSILTSCQKGKGHQKETDSKSWERTSAQKSATEAEIARNRKLVDETPGQSYAR